MLSGKDLREYREREHLSQRDIARYCEVCHELIGQVERGDVGVTEYNYKQIVNGINGALQARVRGTFDKDKAEESKEEVVKKEKVSKTATTKKKADTSHKVTPKGATLKY